jgi:hypothetical protein
LIPWGKRRSCTGEQRREGHLTRWSPGEVEQHIRSPFWGSQGEQEGHKRVLGGGEVELRVEQTAPAWEGKGRCGSVLGKGRGVQGSGGEVGGGLEQRDGAQQGGGRGWQFGAREAAANRTREGK